MRDSERGAVTAEFAIVLPAVLLVLLLAVGSIMAASKRLALTSAAAEVARLEARGDDAAAAARIAQLGSGVGVNRSQTGALHCVTLSRGAGGGPLEKIQVSAEGCAAVSAP